MNAPHRSRTRQLSIGDVRIGGGAPVVVQSMTNTDTRDAGATLEQIRRLHAAGCEIVRLAVPDEKAAAALKTIAASSPVPLVADIHFDYRLALAALDAGLRGLRINPGNIGGEKPVDNLADAAKACGAVIRVGVNSGSVEKDLLERYGGPTPEALVESALSHVHMLEKRGFYDIKVSLKSSSVADTIAAYRLMAARADYPLHLGVTEAGTRLPYGRPGAGSGRGLGNPAGHGTSQPGAGNRILPHLRPHGNRPHRHGRKGRGICAVPPPCRKEPSQDCGHGLRGQRPGRSPRGGHRPCRRARQGRYFPQGRNTPLRQRAGGAACGFS